MTKRTQEESLVCIGCMLILLLLTVLNSELIESPTQKTLTIDITHFGQQPAANKNTSSQCQMII